MVESRTDKEYQRVLAGAFERACHGFEHGLPVFLGAVESGAVNTTVLMGSCYSLTAHPMKGKRPRLWSSWRENKGQGPTSFVLSILSFFPRSLMLSGSKVLNPADEPNLQAGGARPSGLTDATCAFNCRENEKVLGCAF